MGTRKNDTKRETNDGEPRRRQPSEDGEKKPSACGLTKTTALGETFVHNS